MSDVVQYTLPTTWPLSKNMTKTQKAELGNKASFVAKQPNFPKQTLPKLDNYCKYS